VLNNYIDLKAEHLTYKAFMEFSVDSLMVEHRVKDLEIELLRKKSGGLLEDPRLWFMLGAGLALWAN